MEVFMYEQLRSDKLIIPILDTSNEMLNTYY